ncbi:PadR family transcriptional regulator [Catellatospora bangladeshensis]|uniref:PadR family transcriptional regulator n=1 Tax=Catellatospora bangladeshensis TaxID=310355 RepID=UPI00361232AC
MIELAILGFLAEQPLHGYELRTRIAQLAGHARPISDGSLYPAINRMEKAGLLERRREAGAAAAQRHTLELTPAGRAELQRRLRNPAELDITDGTRFNVLLAFLGRLGDRTAQAAVLRRRLDFLEAPASFFYAGERRSAPTSRPTCSAAACSPWRAPPAAPSGHGYGRRWSSWPRETIYGPWRSLTTSPATSTPTRCSTPSPPGCPSRASRSTPPSRRR